jgi:hypothetical protein
VSGTGNHAADAADFGGTLPSGTVNFAAGQPFEFLMINVSGDVDVEATEEFVVTLSNPVGAPIATATAAGTIVTDDFAASEALVNNFSQISGAAHAIDSGQAIAQAFTTDHREWIFRTLDLQLAASGGSVEIELRADNAGAPGSILETLPLSVNNGTSLGPLSVTSTGLPLLAANTQYWIVIRGTVGQIAAAEVFGTGHFGVGTVGALKRAATYPTFDAAESTFLLMKVNASPIVPPATATFAVAPGIGAVDSEGNSSLKLNFFTVTRSGDTSGAMSVDYAVTGSGANPTDAADFGGTLPSGTVSFAAGQTSRNVDASNTGDRLVELDETFTVTLTNPTAGTAIATATASGTIQNDDTATVSVVSNGNVTEGNSGTKTIGFTVKLDEVAALPPFTPTIDRDLTVNVSTLNGTASAGSDFAAALNQPVTIPAGQTSATFTVTINGDTGVEADENFSVVLSAPTAAGRSVTIGTGSATASILNDDSSVAITATSADKPEGNSGNTAFTFTVTRAGDTSAAGTVDFAVNGTAINGVDFQGGSLPGGTVSFAAAETSRIVTVGVNGDTAVESDEAFTVTLSNPSGNATIGTASAIGTIRNDDHPPARLVLLGVSTTVDLELLGAPNTDYVIEFSVDLGGWSPLPTPTVTTDGSGVVIVTDPAATEPMRFYRARTAP